jgi:hypothetical protein
MNRANALSKTSCDIPTNVALNAKMQGQKWHYPSRQTRQKVGLPGSRSCHLHPFALFCAWANTVKWLK